MANKLMKPQDLEDGAAKINAIVYSDRKISTYYEDGSQVTLTYDVDDNITTISKSGVYRTTITYDTDNNVTNVDTTYL